MKMHSEIPARRSHRPEVTFRYRGASASTTATGMTTSQSKNLIGRMVKNKRAART